MHYKSSYCFKTKELFHNFDLNRVPSITPENSKLYTAGSRKYLCAKILLYCFYIIILDIIKNNVTFVLPTIARNAFIHVKQFEGESFKSMYRGGKFMGIDYLNSNFKGYQIYYRFSNGREYKEKPIYINHKLKEIFYENINNGKQYY